MSRGSQRGLIRRRRHDDLHGPHTSGGHPKKKKKIRGSSTQRLSLARAHAAGLACSVDVVCAVRQRRARCPGEKKREERALRLPPPTPPLTRLRVAAGALRALKEPTAEGRGLPPQRFSPTPPRRGLRETERRAAARKLLAPARARRLLSLYCLSSLALSPLCALLAPLSKSLGLSIHTPRVPSSQTYDLSLFNYDLSF